MCGFVGIANYNQDITNKQDLLNDMNRLLKYRGPDSEGYLSTEHCLLGHRRLAILDVQNGLQPMSYTYKGKTYRIAYNGEIYNMNFIKKDLITLGFSFTTMCDTEVILASYIAYQEKCVERFEGIFAFIIDDGEKAFVARDQLGVKPLYYHIDDHNLIVASEMKCILKYMGKAVVDEEGMKELLGLGPSVTPGHTIYKGIKSLRPAHYMYFKDKEDIHCYWKLENQEHKENLEETIIKVKELVVDSIQRQLLSDVPVSTMLSGGLDSSIITAIASQFIQPLSTFSITYEDQKKYFKAYDYQTTMDDVYIKDMCDTYPTSHHEVELKLVDLIENLEESMRARDMPAMADIDSSFLLFSGEIRKTHKVCLSGECADEIFGGYPWFYKEELYSQPYFPWMRDLDAKIDLLHDDIKKLNVKDYILQRYQETLDEIDTTDHIKRMIYLNVQWFMQTLLARADSQTMRSSIEVRVPFASTKILQYLYNMPEEFIFAGNEEKGILRRAFEDYLPYSITHRKKNPYPKTHNPIYTDLIQQKLKDSLSDETNILYSFFDREKLYEFIESKGASFSAPWYGQLMTGPQLMAYFYQIYLWGKIYNIELEFSDK